MSRRCARSFNATTDNAELSVLSRELDRYVVNCVRERVALWRRDLFHRHANAVTILLLYGKGV